MHDGGPSSVLRARGVSARCSVLDSWVARGVATNPYGALSRRFRGPQSRAPVSGPPQVPAAPPTPRPRRSRAPSPQRRPRWLGAARRFPASVWPAALSLRFVSAAFTAALSVPSASVAHRGREFGDVAAHAGPSSPRRSDPCTWSNVGCCLFTRSARIDAAAWLRVQPVALERDRRHAILVGAIGLEVQRDEVAAARDSRPASARRRPPARPRCRGRWT